MGTQLCFPCKELWKILSLSLRWGEGRQVGRRGREKLVLGSRIGGSRDAYFKSWSTDTVETIKGTGFFCIRGVICSLNSSPVFSFHKPRLCVTWDWDPPLFVKHSWYGYSPCCSLQNTAGLQIASGRRKNGQLSTLLTGPLAGFLPAILGNIIPISKSNIIFWKDVFLFRILGTLASMLQS